MKDYRLSRPPRALRRSAVHLDNLALVPASLLPFKAQWQAIANDLPEGQILIVLPWQTKQQQIARSVAAQLKAKGKQVRVMVQEPQRITLQGGIGWTWNE